MNLQEKIKNRLNIIILELESGVAPHLLRSHFDVYHCLMNGFINKNDKINWKQRNWNITKTTTISIVASTKTTTTCKTRLDHIVPIQVIIKKLQNEKLTLNIIEKILTENLFLATITIEEDKKLLTSTMPDEYYDKNHELFGDIFARYKIAGIKCKDFKMG